MAELYTQLVSLSLVSPELSANVEQAVVKLEQFNREPDNAELLNDAVNLVSQFHGALRMVQLGGVEILSGELLALLGQLQAGREASTDDFAAISSSLFILPRYLEFTSQRKLSLPELLLPQINALRVCGGQSELGDSYFFGANVLKLKSPPGGSSVIREEFGSLVRRLRHMYQLGLLQTIRDPNANALMLMERAMQRLLASCGGYRFATFWWVASKAMSALQAGVSLSGQRKVLLRNVDREIRRLHQKGEPALDQPPKQELLRELLYIASLAPQDDEFTEQLTMCMDGHITYHETRLRQYQQELHGPSLNTVHSVIKVLTEEFKVCQSILEMAAQAGDNLIVEFDELVNNLSRITEALGVLGLTRAGDLMREQLNKIRAWNDNVEPYNSSGLADIADALVYVESTVIGLENLSLNVDNLEQVNHLANREAVAGSILIEAEAIVIRESQSGLTMVKRALSSYAESHYDLHHIGNISANISSIRGGLDMVGLSRAGAMVASVHNFVDQVLLSGSQPPALDTLLETLADAIISLEYYLASYGALQYQDDAILVLGEESMASLGFPVMVVEANEP